MQMEEKATFLAYYALFKKGKNATETHTQNIYAVNEEGVATELTFQKWFAKFHAGCFLLDNIPQSCTPVEVDSNQMETLRTISVYHREITAALKIPKSSTENPLCQLSYVNPYDV